MNLAVEPFKNGISDLEKRINELEEVKSECTLFSIFSVDRNESAKTSQKYEEPKKMNQSEADVLDANDPNSPVGDGKREKESEEWSIQNKIYWMIVLFELIWASLFNIYF